MEVVATEGAARAGTVRTARGSYATPAFMPVGTRGAVKALDSVDLGALGAEVVLANTYHLMLRPGVGTVARLGGLHRFTGWDGHTLTDSGGYQVHSLGPSVDDDGVTFASVYDGDRVRLTPESVVEAQGLIGADIQMVLDVCATLPASPEVLRVAVERTAAWAARARRHHERLEARPEAQALFGIVQGGTDPLLRAESAERTVALGVDQFDCVAPTRMARHGTVLTRHGKINLRNAVHAEDDSPLEDGCGCLACSRWSRGYLRHLLGVGEPTAWRLVSIHNLAFVLRLMSEARAAIVEGRFSALRASTSEAWATRA